MVAGEQLFSAAELARLRSWPPEIGSAELVQFFTLAGDDLDWLAVAARGATSRFGLAVQLCALPWLGFVPDDVASVPVAVSTRLASQLGISRDRLEGYGARAQSRTEHLRLVAARLGVAHRRRRRVERHRRVPAGSGDRARRPGPAVPAGL